MIFQNYFLFLVMTIWEFYKVTPVRGGSRLTEKKGPVGHKYNDTYAKWANNQPPS